MARLANESARAIGLPGWRDPQGKMRGAVMLHSGASLEVPDGYVDYLERDVRGVAALFALERGGIRIERDAVKTALAPAAAVLAETTEAKPKPKKNKR